MVHSSSSRTEPGAGRPRSVFFAATVRGAALSPLGARGYHAVPEPQRVTLRGGDLEFGPGWRLKIAGVQPDDVAIQRPPAGAHGGYELPGLPPIAVAAGQMGRPSYRLQK